MPASVEMTRCCEGVAEQQRQRQQGGSGGHQDEAGHRDTGVVDQDGHERQHP